MSTLVSLFLVLLAIAAAAFLLKRLGPGQSPQARLLRIVGQLPLGAREKISIVELDDQWFVLGVTSQQITLLAQTARRDDRPAPAEIGQFSKLFQLNRGERETT